MANSDYIQSGVGSFAANITLDTPVDQDTGIFSFTDFNYPRIDAVVVGSVGMIENEIFEVIDVGIRQFTVKRGCADTIPAIHVAGTLCWFFDTATGTDRREYSATQVIGVKVSPFTTGGGAVPINTVSPDAVEFNWRFFRPYPPAQMMINGARWHVDATVSEAQPNLAMSWVDRDRILQANQLLGQDDAGIGPEPGTTYTLRVHDTSGTLLRTEVGIRGTTFNYQWPQVVYDFGPSTTGYLVFGSTREQFDSLYGYVMNITVDPAGTLTSDFLPFDQLAIESPYIINVALIAPPDYNYGVGVAARPADRMADVYRLLGAPIDDGQNKFTPWVTADFKLPELETILNVRSSSLYDGVVVTPALIGTLALIDGELTEVLDVTDSQITLARGVGDTVPQVHLPGARLWFIGAGHAFDVAPQGDSAIATYKFMPGVYGPPVDPASLPSNQVTFNRRAQMPYAPGQVVVNGRPWFEEAQATSGASTLFSWARRNRLTQGATPYDHGQDDVLPEDGQITVLTFYYETPPITPGEAPVQHVLRTVPLAGNIYSYSYANALIDGQAAGTATGVCGTVVVYVRIESSRDGYVSWQNYITPLRLPSFPCAA